MSFWFSDETKRGDAPPHSKRDRAMPGSIFFNIHFILFIFYFLFFGCVGSSFLCEGFL